MDNKITISYELYNEVCEQLQIYQHKLQLIANRRIGGDKAIRIAQERADYVKHLIDDLAAANRKDEVQ